MPDDDIILTLSREAAIDLRALLGIEYGGGMDDDGEGHVRYFGPPYVPEILGLLDAALPEIVAEEREEVMAAMCDLNNPENLGDIEEG